MSNYTAVTGKLGAGKGLCTVGRIRDYLARDKPIVTNMDLYPEHFKDKYNDKIRIYRIPDKPKVSDLLMCGLGNDTKDPEENGLAALDECATWFNAHDWNKPESREINDFLVHLRKRGWDAIFQVQSIESMNTQAKRNIITSEARCQFVKQIYVPILSPFIRLITGRTPKLPKFMRFHSMRMTNLESGILEEKLRYRGEELYKYYDTSQIFDSSYPHGTYCLLTPWHLVGRYETKQPLTLKKALLNLVWYWPLTAAAYIGHAISGIPLPRTPRPPKPIKRSWKDRKTRYYVCEKGETLDFTNGLF